MPRFHVFRSQADVGLDGSEDEEPKFVFIPEMDILTGIFVAGSNPLLSKEPEAEVEAETLAAAKLRFKESREHVFD